MPAMVQTLKSEIVLYCGSTNSEPGATGSAAGRRCLPHTNSTRVGFEPTQSLPLTVLILSGALGLML